MEEKRYAYQQLIDFVTQVFVNKGFHKAESSTIAKNLLIADLRGIDSHGVARLSGYLRLMEAGRISVNANPQVIRQNATTAVLDADKSLGLLVAEQAMNLAIEKAHNTGTGMVSVSNSSHYGIAGNYAMMALPKNMIGISLTNASALVAPTRSKKRMLGTNPIAVAIPAKKYPAFVADFATTTAANGKLEILQRKGLDTPTGWLQTEQGISTTDANALSNKGALLPLGSDELRSSHKGYALGAIVDIFSAVFSGANFGPWVPPFPAYVPIPENPVGKGIGHFFMAIRIDNWEEESVFLDRMDTWIEAFKNATPIDNSKPVLIPGEPEFLSTQDRLKNGIPLHPKVESELMSIAVQLGINL